MDRRDFYFKQAVTEAELNGAFDAVEIALWRLITDWGLFGIASGMVGAQMTPTPTMAVSISGPGYAYDAQGERIFIAAPWAPQPNGLDLSLDSNQVPTVVTTVGKERWVSVFVKFQRALSDPRVDGSSNTVFFQSNESYEFVVVQANEDTIGIAPKADRDSTMLLLFDVHLVNGQTSVLNSDIDTTRRQDTFVLAQTPVPLRAGNVQSSIAAMLQALNNHILGIIGPHPDTGITSVARPGTHFSLASGSVGSQLLAIQGELDTLAPAVAGGTIAKTNFTIAAEPLANQVVDLATQVDNTETGLGMANTNVGHKLTKDGTDSITGAVTVSGTITASNVRSITAVPGGVYAPKVTRVVTSGYAADGSGFDEILLVDTSIPGHAAITLPAPAAGRQITVKDGTGGVDGGATTIVVSRHSTESVDGGFSKTITTAWGVLRFVSDGTDWFSS